MTWQLIKKISVEERKPEQTLNAMKLYNHICLQAKCLMKRDKLSYKDLVKRLASTGLTPTMKKMKADAIKEMDLETCSL